MITEEELIRMLDGFAESDTGRCDVCSPWATGQPIGAEIEPEE